MSDQQQSLPPTRTWQWIVFSCLVTTLLPANVTIVRPDPVVSAFERIALLLVLHLKTLLFPQLVLFEAVAHFGNARIIRDRVNDAARRAHHAYAAVHFVPSEATQTSQPTTCGGRFELIVASLIMAKTWISCKWNLLCGNTVNSFVLVRAL